jgi:hypothetical protein
MISGHRDHNRPGFPMVIALVWMGAVGAVAGGVLSYREWRRHVKRRSPWAGHPSRAIARGAMLGAAVGAGAAAAVTLLQGMTS